jgi:DNA (cytosine-5)-methyltransferase 1
MPSNLLTVANVAKKLKITPQYVRGLIRDNKILSERVGNQWLVLPENLNKYIKANDVIIEPDDHERLSDDVPEITALSFFSGAMGLDIGMENAGIHPVLACEFEKHCRMTIAANKPDMALIGDINKYSGQDILKLAKIPKDRKVDIMFGGPPCQAFSTAGNRKGLDDTRGNVFLKYIELVNDIKPTYVVIENVRGLLSAPYPYGKSKEPINGGALMIILDKLREIGYTVSFNLYNSANYGAPQVRERVVIIGKLGDKKVPYLKPTNSENSDPGLLPWKTLADAFCQIPKNKRHNYIEFPEKRLRFYRILKEGQYWKHLSPELQLEAMGEKLKLGGGKTGFLRRLAFSKPSPTLVTNPTMPATDLAHPTENRPLSVEEYASIQGFPQDWKICGPILEQYKQIGNAVPVKLGEAIAKAILDDMSGVTCLKTKSFSYSRYKNTDEISWEKDFRKRLNSADTRSQILLFD